MMIVDPLIYEPGMHTKDDLFCAGRRLARAFNEHHEMFHFRLRITTSLAHYGCYAQRSRTMLVNIKRSLIPAKTPGYSWSYPGYKADLTAAGIIAHETGHHTWHYVESMHPRTFMQWRRDWTTTCKNEASVSSYEENPEEAFAESVKVFILNPTLLEEGRPGRYHMMTVGLGLEPIHKAHWTEVLANAHPAWYVATKKWIER